MSILSSTSLTILTGWHGVIGSSRGGKKQPLLLVAGLKSYAEYTFCHTSQDNKSLLFIARELSKFIDMGLCINPTPNENKKGCLLLRQPLNLIMYYFRIIG
jgi:hypothetical protein